MWRYDKANKWGIFTRNQSKQYNCHSIYIEGSFKNDLQHGFSLMKLGKDNTYFEGMFLNGKKEGWGLLKTSDGALLEGHWNNAKMNGLGSYIWPDGR